MIEFTFNFNPAPIDRALAAFQESLADYSPALRLIADDFREMISEQFASEGRAGGTPWAELAPSTLRRKPTGSSGILYSTGALLRSLRDSGAPGHVEELEAESLTLGSRLPYAQYHQTGTGWGVGRTESASAMRQGPGMPMRPLIVVSRQRSDVWAEMFQQALEGKALLLSARELG